MTVPVWTGPGPFVRISILLLLAFADGVMAVPAEAFWQRSRLQACREAQTPQERHRLQCREFEPVQEWPMPYFVTADPPRRLPPPSPRR